MLCRKLFWMPYRRSTARKIYAECSAQLPEMLGAHEEVARFVFEPRHLYKGDHAGRIKPMAFKPEPYDGTWELSVCRKEGITEERIWNIGGMCRSPKVAIARGDVRVVDVHAQDLFARAAPSTFPEHSVVLGWPPPDGEDKSAMMMRQTALARAARCRMAGEN